MDKYIYDENNGLWYELKGDYYIPCLGLPAEEERPIGFTSCLLYYLLTSLRKLNIIEMLLIVI